MSAHLPMLELDRLWKTYGTPKGPATIVKNFNLKLKEGEFATLIGHSGCGKSTVLMMVAGLSDPTQGNMILGGREASGPGPDRGIVFQSPCLLPWMSAFENVMLGVNQVYYTASKAERRQMAEYYLSIVGLGDAMHKYPGELSQGMRQRVGIARAFALLELWRRNRITTLMVTHDVDEAIFLSDRVVMMTDGPEAELGDILQIPFERPRNRKQIMEDPRYYELREHLITFLNDRSHIRPSHDPKFVPSPDMAAELAGHALSFPAAAA